MTKEVKDIKDLPNRKVQGLTQYFIGGNVWVGPAEASNYVVSLNAMGLKII